MTPNQKVLNLIGLARRAGQQTTGTELVLQAVRNQTVKLVFVASDAGADTQKKFHDKCQFYHTPLITAFTRAEISQATGSQRSVIAINDRGFADKMLTLMQA